MPPIKASITLSVILGLAVTIGCRMCASPYDYAGPVISSSDCSRCRSSARAGSAFAGTMDQHDQQVMSIVENAPVNDRGDYENVEQPSMARAKVFQSRQLGRPLTREDIDPFVRLGIPPENIVSVTDRPLEPTVDENPQPVPDSLASGAAKEPKPLPSEREKDRATTAGWVRLGERTSATLR